VTDSTIVTIGSESTVVRLVDDEVTIVSIDDESTVIEVGGDVGPMGPQGATGPQGPTGSTGAQGDDGIEVSAVAPVNTTILWADTSEPGDAVIPAGGTTGQVLVKNSGTDYDTGWASYLAVPNTAGTTFFGIPGASIGPWTASQNLSGTRPTALYSPFIVREPVTISAYQHRIASISGTTPISVTLTVRVWSANTSWQPIAGTSSLLGSVTLTANAATVTEVTGLSVALAPGRYLTEVIQASDANSVNATLFAVPVEGTPVHELNTTPQNPGRVWTRTSASAGDGWNAVSGTTVSTGFTQHFVLYRWSMT
jgi:hypothetical protein